MVTGAAGYIGGQTVLNLRDQGHWVLAVDRDPMPAHLQNASDDMMQDDFASDAVLSAIGQNGIDAIVHCAGTSLVGPSVSKPCEYYENNFVKTKRLCDFILSRKPDVRLIFSSSAAVYGEPVFTPCHEEDPIMPISPYGESKAMIEWMLNSYNHAYGLNYVAFRYFNACGADQQGRHGQAPGATHIIARVLESIRDNVEFQLYGTDYDTVDGTCVRDYVHVEDIVRAHLQALDENCPVGSYNLGTGEGASNREIIEVAQHVTGRDLWVNEIARRAGDPGVLTAQAERWHHVSGWQPEHDLTTIISSAWRWYQRVL